MSVFLCSLLNISRTAFNTFHTSVSPFNSMK